VSEFLVFLSLICFGLLFVGKFWLRSLQAMFDSKLVYNFMISASLMDSTFVDLSAYQLKEHVCADKENFYARSTARQNIKAKNIFQPCRKMAKFSPELLIQQFHHDLMKLFENHQTYGSDGVTLHGDLEWLMSRYIFCNIEPLSFSSQNCWIEYIFVLFHDTLSSREFWHELALFYELFSSNSTTTPMMPDLASFWGYCDSYGSKSLPEKQWNQIWQCFVIIACLFMELHWPHSIFRWWFVVCIHLGDHIETKDRVTHIQSELTACWTSCGNKMTLTEAVRLNDGRHVPFVPLEFWRLQLLIRRFPMLLVHPCLKDRLRYFTTVGVSTADSIGTDIMAWLKSDIPYGSSTSLNLSKHACIDRRVPELRKIMILLCSPADLMIQMMYFCCHMDDQNMAMYIFQLAERFLDKCLQASEPDYASVWFGMLAAFAEAHAYYGFQDTQDIDCKKKLDITQTEKMYQLTLRFVRDACARNQSSLDFWNKSKRKIAKKKAAKAKKKAAKFTIKTEIETETYSTLTDLPQSTKSQASQVPQEPRSDSKSVNEFNEFKIFNNKNGVQVVLDPTRLNSPDGLSDLQHQWIQSHLVEPWVPKCIICNALCTSFFQCCLCRRIVYCGLLHCVREHEAVCTRDWIKLHPDDID